MLATSPAAALLSEQANPEDEPEWRGYMERAEALIARLR